MNEAGLERLRVAASAASARQAMQALEDGLTPLELQQLLPALEQLPPMAQLASQQSEVLRVLRRTAAQPYRRTEIGPDVALFSAPSVPAERKALLVAFCGRTNRVMLPWSLFLQHLPAALFDVVILTDRSNLHYFDGVAGYATGFFRLVRRLLADTGANRYRRIIGYGTSSGGFPALRFGLLAGAYRAISVGGTWTWPIYRLETGQPLDAFDPLCACNRLPGTHLVCVHANGAERDAVSAEQLQRIVKVSRLPVDGTDEHNIVYVLYRAGRLSSFFGQLLDFELRPAAVSRRMPTPP